ncbi:MAG: hypothetical protein ABSE27_08500 [Acidobacteriaceae bacterium]
MARKVGQIIRRETGTWLVRVYSGRDPETKRRKYLNQTIHGGLRDAQAHLNKMLSERDRGLNLDSSKQTLNLVGVVFVKFDPRHSGTVYVGAYTGGIYRSPTAAPPGIRCPANPPAFLTVRRCGPCATVCST